MKKLLCQLVTPVSLLAQASTLFAAVRFYEWHGEMHPLWWGVWGIGMLLLMLLLVVLTMVGFVVAIRWLVGKGRSLRTDSALTILRDRYARSEINKEEFEQKKKDLS